MTTRPSYSSLCTSGKRSPTRSAWRFRLASIADRFKPASVPDRLLYVNVARQQLRLIEKGVTRKIYRVSTSAFGTGNREGSNQTPLGLHRICEKIGAGAPRGRIFRNRRDTGIDWRGGTANEENLILTRILRLEGMEEGVNCGKGIDSYERMIYIHGTNREDRIGTPISHGCIVMRNDDVADLFERVEVGTLVLID